MRADLIALAERCEAAAGPSEEERQLVIDAYNLCFPHELTLSDAERGDDKTRYNRIIHRVRFGNCINIDYKRASLDAAVMLVPDSTGDAGEHYRLEAYNSSGVLAAHVRASAWVPGAKRAFAATPTLALTAAALRARASIEQEQSNG